MRERPGAQQRPRSAQIIADRPFRRVQRGVDDVLGFAAQPQPIGAVTAIAFHGKHGVDPMRLAQREIILAMVGRHVDKPGAGIRGDEIAGQEGAGTREEVAQLVHRVPNDSTGQRRCGNILLHGQRRTDARAHCLHQWGGNEDAVAVLRAAKLVGDLRPISDALVHRDRPRRRCPDNRVRAHQFRRVRRFHDLERHVDLGRGDVVIFHLGIGQRGFFHGGPHDRLGTAIKLAAFGKLQQFGNDGRFRLEVHGEIGFFPIGADAQPLQLFALHVHPMLGIGAAFGAEFHRRHIVLVLLFRAVGFFHLPFDGQAVAIPTGDIGRILAQQRLRAHHRILQDMVQRVADVHVAVGVGRAIVEDELRPPGAGFTQLGVKIGRLPYAENLRLALRQASFHRKVGFRQENGGAIIGRGHDGGL